MFDVGFSELILIFVIGLLILGPERLPRVAAQIGRWVARARRTANQLRHQLEREMALDDITRNQKPPRPKPTGEQSPEQKSTDQKPPGDETAGASHSIDPSPGAGDVPSDAASSPASGFGESGTSSQSETQRPDDNAPKAKRHVEETAAETTTSNS